MKTRILLICAIGICSCTTKAQLRFGGRMALTESTIKPVVSADVKLLTGISIGAFSRIEIGKRFLARPEISYLLKGSRYSTSGTSNSKQLLHNLSIPILMGYKASQKINVFLGPQVDFLLKARSKAANGSFDNTDFYKTTEISGTVGASYQLNNKLGIDLRYTQGLTPILEIEVMDGTGNVSEVIKRKTYVFQLGLSYLIK